MNFHFLGTNHPPATLGFYAPISRLGAWSAMTQAITMRHLVKTVFTNNRAYLNWLE